MQDWFGLISKCIGLHFVRDAEGAVPFGLACMEDLDEDWQKPSVSRVDADTVKLNATHPSGLCAEWFMRSFPDTKAIECYGTVKNCGTAPVKNVLESQVLNMRLVLDAGTQRLRLRTVNGVGRMPVVFPPYDFRVDDKQLVLTHQPYLVHLQSQSDGMSSGKYIPAAIVCDEPGRNGLALMLEWSGIWRIGVGLLKGETAPVLKLQAGISGLNLHLQPGESLPFPRLLMTAFEGSLEEGSNSLRRHIRRHVTPRLAGMEVLPPTSFNHWFAFGNNFAEGDLRPAVDASAKAGLEYFCVDGGWFRQGFRKGIGNWSEGDPSKFPSGIRPFAEYVRSKGMKYGTWFEPEWADQDSELYTQHPEWFLRTPAVIDPALDVMSTDPRVHMLNMGLPDVRQWWLDRFEQAYSEWGMRWVRWDFNQSPRLNWGADVPVGKMGWHQIEHVLGLYRLLDDIIDAFPDLFIEQCASGGHRIDLGTARRGHSFWMNDHTTNSDIIRSMQYGLNHVLPGNYANTNLCQFRHDYTDYDYLSHGMGGLGYSGRIWEASDEELASLEQAVEHFKRYRRCLMGDMHGTGSLLSLDAPLSVQFEDADERVSFEFTSLPQRSAGAIVSTRNDG